MSQHPQEPRPGSGPDAKTCWVITSGQAGTQNQALGLAEAIGEHMPLAISVKKVEIPAPWKHLPGGVWPDPFSILTSGGHLLRAPFPDLWVAAGRLTVPFTIAVKKQTPKIFTVQLQNPHAPSSLFDMVIPPEHDGLVGKNVYPMIGAPSRITQETINELSQNLQERFAHLHGPTAVVLIGGSNRVLKMTNQVVERLCENLKMHSSEGIAMIISNSRRTKEEHWAYIRENLQSENVVFVDSVEKRNDQAYPGILGLADYILVTEDSVNMIGEAAASGKPVFRFGLDGNPGKFSTFYDKLESLGILRKFEGGFEGWDYSPLNETARTAELVVERWTDAT